MKYLNIPYSLHSLLFGLLFFSFGIVEELSAQQSLDATAGMIQNRVKSKIRNRALDEMADMRSALKSSARVKVKGSKRALQNSLRGGVAGDPFDTDPTLDKLIEDPESKESIVDNTNKKRYVELFGEWMMMPSEAEMLARARLKHIKDSLANIDRKAFRVTKRVWDDSRPMIIFGWHPHWVGDIYKGYDYDLFNVVSYYSYDINPDNGAPQNSGVVASFLGSDFVATAHKKRSAALLSVTCHGEENVMRFLSQNIPAQQRFTDSILYILDSTNADGIEINFEGVNAAVKNDFVKFVRILSKNIIGARGDTSFIFMSVPAYDPENIYDLALFHDFVDIFVIKGYTFHETPDGLKKMPPAPLNYSPLTLAPDLRTAVEKYIASIGPLHSARLIMALPYFGTRWVTDGITEEILEFNSLTYSDIQFDFAMNLSDSIRYPGGKLFYDSIRTSYAFTYLDYTGVDVSNGDIPLDVTIYFDDSLSLQKKYRYLIDARLGGVGIQFLGYDMGFTQLEDVLSNEFTDIVMPLDDNMAQLNARSTTIRQNSIYILATLLYLAIFMAIGFCAALFNKNVRQALFDNGRFRMGYMAFFTILMLLLGGYLGLFEGASIPLLLGVIFGSIVSWVAWRILFKKKAMTP